MKKIILIIFWFGILVLGYYSLIFEPNNLQIEKKIIALKDLPQSFHGLRIVHLTDFHSFWFGSRERKVLTYIKELEPDFVFITGDFVDPVTKLVTDRNLSSVRVFWQALGQQYQGRIFAVLGNHDPERVGKYLQDSGIEVLDNENKKIWKNQEFIYLIGVDDPWTGRDDLPKAVEGIKEDKPKILLAHAPEIIYRAVKKEIDLVLVGHTHGGQVNIPFIGRLIQPLSEYGRKYMSGLFEINSTFLYVNRGVGTSVIPVRFNCPPEIALIELVYLR